jgi:uncharacterized membrane protein YkoI
MPETNKEAFIIMLLIATTLASLGVWQFGGVDLAQHEEHDSDDWHEDSSYQAPQDQAATPANSVIRLLNRIASQQDARIIEIEREREHGQEIYEIKFMGPGNRVREVKIGAGDDLDQNHITALCKLATPDPDACMKQLGSGPVQRE